MDIVGLTKQFNVTIPQLINSFDTSDIRLIFSTLSSLVKLRLLLIPTRILSPSSSLLIIPCECRCLSTPFMQ